MLKSVIGITENEIVINKSKFIGILIHVSNTADVQNYIDIYQQKYPNATHYCYAYIIDQKIKANDDGEPSNTAGMPILNVLEKQQLDHVLAIVVRYFGGIKLGAGGLVRAYTQITTKTLLKAKICQYSYVKLYEITFAYQHIKLVDYYIRTMNIITIDQKYEENVLYYCLVPDKTFLEMLENITSNQIEIKYLRDELTIKEDTNE